jgi:uncharacterized pyridoxal phosphate-containing UPF0001 family protein
MFAAVYIAKEETKFGLDENELDELITNAGINSLKNITIRGLMGMASFSADMNLVRNEFRFLKNLFDKYSQLTIHASRFTTLSMGMSADYKIAIEERSTMIRIGSLIFGDRGT